MKVKSENEFISLVWNKITDIKKTRAKILGKFKFKAQRIQFYLILFVERSSASLFFILWLHLARTKVQHIWICMYIH